MADLGEEDRVRHRRVVEFLGVVVFLHPEGAEAAARRLVGRNAGGDRPVVALDAIDRDGHLLRILVDGDGDIRLRGAGGEQRQASESNEEGTHFTLASGLDCSAALRPPHNMPGMRLWFQRPVWAIVNAALGANKAQTGFYRAGKSSFRDGPKDRTSDGQLRIGESRHFRRSDSVFVPVIRPSRPRIHHGYATFWPHPWYKFAVRRCNRGRAEGIPDEDNGQNIEAFSRFAGKTPSCGCGNRARIARDSRYRARPGYRARGSGGCLRRKPGRWPRGRCGWRRGRRRRRRRDGRGQGRVRDSGSHLAISLPRLLRRLSSFPLHSVVDRSSLRANGSRERAPDDRLREAIQSRETRLDCFVAEFIIGPAKGGNRWLLAMTKGAVNSSADSRS